MRYRQRVVYRNTRRMSKAGLLIALIGAFGLSGCGDIFDVTNPGQIQDQDLNRLDAIPPLVTGISADYSVFRASSAIRGAYIGDEVVGSTSGPVGRDQERGLVRAEDVNGQWNDVQRARFAAEDGIRRMQEVMQGDFENSALAARAHVFATLANLGFGESWCEVVFEGGPALPRSAAFERSLEWVQRGIPIAERTGSANFRLAMIGASATAHLWLGNGSAAVAAAAQIPTEFVFNAVYSANSLREENAWENETHNRQNTSLFNTRADRVPQDPRAPYTDCVAFEERCVSNVGSDGTTPFLRAEKFPTRSAPIPAVTGREMRLIEAEVAIMNGNVSLAIEKMNAVRALFSGLEMIDPADYPAVAASSFDKDDPVWRLLDEERFFGLWLEGKRLGDLHRWNHPFLDGGRLVLEPLPRRASCIPISLNELQTNPNLSP